MCDGTYHELEKHFGLYNTVHHVKLGEPGRSCHGALRSASGLSRLMSSNKALSPHPVCSVKPPEHQPVLCKPQARRRCQPSVLDAPCLQHQRPSRSMLSDPTMTAYKPSARAAVSGSCRQRPRPQAALPRLLPLLVLAIVTGWQPLAPAPLRLAAAAPVPLDVSTAAQLVAAIGNEGVSSVRLTANVRVDPAAWPASLLVRSSDFTVEGADWFPILDFAFVESKVQLQPGVTFEFGTVELRNVRTLSGYELDIFVRSPNATVRYRRTVYFCFSCLPPSVLVQSVSSLSSALYARPGSPAPAASTNETGWTRTQAALAETYPPSHVVLFRSASTVLAPSGVPGATSGGGYEIQAEDAILVCQSPIDISICERGIDYCLSTAIERLAKQDTTWTRLAAWDAGGGGGGAAGAGGGGPSGSGGGGEGAHESVPIGAAVGGAVGGTAGLAAVVAAAVLYYNRRSRRQLAGASGDATSSPADGPTAIKIVMTGAGEGKGGEEKEEEGVEGGGGDKTGSGKRGDGCGISGIGGGGGKGFPELESSGNGSSAEVVAQANASMARSASTAAATGTPPPPPHGGFAAAGTAAATDSASVPLASATSSSLTAGMALAAAVGGGGGGDGGAATGCTLGESYRPLNSSEGAPSMWPLAAGAGFAMSAKSMEERALPPVVIVSGITIEVMGSIGTGSFGKVFRGSWQGRPVAVKVLQYGAELCKAVHNEVLLSQTLRHPNVVAALCFAQIPPGGRLGLHTGGGLASGPGGTGAGGGGGGPLPRSPAPNHRTGPSAPAGLGPAPAAAGTEGCGGGGGGGVAGGGQHTADARSYSRFILSGTAPSPGSMGVGGTADAPAEAAAAMAAAAAELQAPLDRFQPRGGGGGGGAAGGPRHPDSQDPSPEARGNGGAAVPLSAAAAVVPTCRRRRHTMTASASLPLSLPGAEDIGWLKGGGSQTCSAPSSWLRPSDLSAVKAAELAGAGSHETSGSSDDDDGGGGDGGRSCSQPDVLSRWDEQRRQQKLVERVGANLIGPELVVTSKGFVLQAAGGGAAAAAAGPENALPPVAAPVAVSACVPALSSPPVPADAAGGGGGAPRAAPAVPDSALRASSSTTGPPTAAAGAAAAALPLEALWLASHTQPAAGISHGFLVMELCERGSLAAWRATHWNGPEERPDLSVLLRLALDIAYGMSYIHSMGICHGDLKLSNVLLAGCCDASTLVGAISPNDPPDLLAGWVAKVCDFGLSRVLTNDRTHVSTRPYGTPTHMAPELWTKGHVSQPADVYAFGITLWELATGERPYKGLNAARILHRVLLNGGRPALPLWLPPSYTRLVTSCWAQSPKDRPAFGEIVRHLEAMLAVLAAVTPR
ncbi:hypothetical protein PLESTB_000988200 [Pleodorina starrii]|uniref:Protein kinase domain-containing protein n=1 Tax=Pleodorina starrii TaxID=330485 RepID=A0A9W6BPK7_9CHLO|nr:hypothetical protein PLESTM_000550800 [Pleodorina starrii]GLC55447.1 hypothetical protein PLESTB_000988200 [Pleodorina starrii]GLC73840.1 hypothetical protein PLESTF_001426600 [Pleodorina starrii]